MWKKKEEDDTGIGEFCMECGKTKWWNKVNGRVDNREYGKEHKLDILQPYTDGQFEKFYGNQGK